MLCNIGYFSLVIAFAATVYSALAAIFGAIRRRPNWVESARHALQLTLPLTTISVLALITLLIGGHYEVGYVASATDSAMPAYLKAVALWAGQAGSLLFWSWLMAAFAAAAVLGRWKREAKYLPWVIVVTMVTLAFFLSLLIFFENPFARLWKTFDGRQVAALFQPVGGLPLILDDGRGLNPLLRHPGMIIHPPMLYLGFVSFVVLYALYVAALISGSVDERWTRITRRWSLIAWLFLSLGLILGSRWSYDVLGWGGYWGWDPVEISALMPWLTGTAFLHSLMMQERKGIFRRWTTVLIMLTYSLVIFGTFLTRSGIVSSVHTFAQSEIGPMFLIFIAIILVGSMALLIWRWGDLKTENEVGSLLSREALILFLFFLLLGILAICFWGVVFPTVSEFFSGRRMAVGPDFYKKSTGPLWAGLILLMGAASLSAYGRISIKALGAAIWKPGLGSIAVIAALLINGVRNLTALIGYGLAAFAAMAMLYEFWRKAKVWGQGQGESLTITLRRLMSRNHRRYGGCLIHLGIVLIAIGILGIEIFQTETQDTLALGEQITLGRYAVRYDGLSQFDLTDGRNITRAAISVYHDDDYLGSYFPRIDYYYRWQQSVTIPAVRSTMADDLYIRLVSWGETMADGATFRVYRNPLVNFIWASGPAFILGVLLILWPKRKAKSARLPATSHKDIL